MALQQAKGGGNATETGGGIGHGHECVLSSLVAWRMKIRMVKSKIFGDVYEHKKEQMVFFNLCVRAYERGVLEPKSTGNSYLFRKKD